MIQSTTVIELFADPDWDDLIREYEMEAAVKGAPPISAKVSTYDALEKAGILFPYEARIAGRLIGFIVVLATSMPHYHGIVLAMSESFFVSRLHRMSGAGLRLLKVAEEKARELGSPGLFVSAPSGGHLAGVLPRMGYAETNRVFFKALLDG